MYLQRTYRRELANRSKNLQHKPTEHNFGDRWEVRPLIRNVPTNFNGLLPPKKPNNIRLSGKPRSVRKEQGKSVRTSINLICYVCKSGVDEEFVLPDQVVKQHYYRYVLLRLRQQVRRKHSEHGVTRTSSFIMTVLLYILRSQCSNFWTRKRDFAPPPSLRF